MAENEDIHRADIETLTRIIVEFQHPPKSDQEKLSYDKTGLKCVRLVWKNKFMHGVMNERQIP